MQTTMNVYSLSVTKSSLKESSYKHVCRSLEKVKYAYFKPNYSLDRMEADDTVSSFWFVSKILIGL